MLTIIKPSLDSQEAKQGKRIVSFKNIVLFEYTKSFYWENQYLKCLILCLRLQYKSQESVECIQEFDPQVLLV